MLGSNQGTVDRLLVACFLLSLYLIGSWYFRRNEQWQCQFMVDQHLTGYENQTSSLELLLEDMQQPVDLQDLPEYYDHLSRINWETLSPNIKNIETHVTHLIDLLESVGLRFATTTELRSQLNREVQEYDQCRLRVRGDNKEISQRCESLLTLRKHYLDNMQIVKDEMEAARARQTSFVSTWNEMKTELQDKENEFKKVDEELENIQESANEELKKLIQEMEKKRNDEMTQYRTQEQELEQMIFKVKSEKESEREELNRIRIKVDSLTTSHDMLRNKLDNLQLRSTYDEELQKLLPSKESIAKSMQLEKTLEQKFNINSMILSKMKGFPGYEDQKREVERLKNEFKEIKLFLSKVNRTIYSFDLNFKRELSNTRELLKSTIEDLEKAEQSKRETEAKFLQASRSLEGLEKQRDELAIRIKEVRERPAPEEEWEAPRQLKERQRVLRESYDLIKLRILELEDQIKSYENSKDEEEKRWELASQKYEAESAELVTNTKEVESDIKKLLIGLKSNLVECRNRRQFIESIKEKGGEELRAAQQYYDDIIKRKSLLLVTLNKVYL